MTIWRRQQRNDLQLFCSLFTLFAVNTGRSTHAFQVYHTQPSFARTSRSKGPQTSRGLAPHRNNLQHETSLLRSQVFSPMTLSSSSSLTSFTTTNNTMSNGDTTQSTTSLSASSSATSADIPISTTTGVNGDHKLASSSADAATNGNTQAVATKQVKVPFPIVLWRFTRPHTLIGSALAIPSLHWLAATSVSQAFSIQTMQSILFCMVPSLLMNLYITGLNQITDVEIDKINKPNLPIAAGILDPSTAIVTVVTALAASLLMGHQLTAWSSPGLLFCLWGSAILGTLYSLPPFRLKRFPALAAFCIVVVRGTVINAGFFAHAKTAAAAMATSSSSSSLLSSSVSSVWSVFMNDPKCFYSSLFFAVFGMVIAFLKDVPDVLGDKLSNVRTLSVRLGTDRVFRLSHRMLTTLFGVVGASMLTLLVKGVMSSSSNVLLLSGRAVTAAGAAFAAWSVQRQTRGVDPENPQQVYKYYMHLWKLFYLSYLVLPLAR